jgi:hypothetical protein
VPGLQRSSPQIERRFSPGLVNCKNPPIQPQAHSWPDKRSI